MMSKNNIFSLLIFLFAFHLFAQTENTLTNSPYTLYGLGLTNDLNTGITNGLGKSGIAMKSNNAINNLNPASLGGIFSNSFFYDIGFKAEIETLNEKGNKENKASANFSNIAIAFPVTKKSGLAITLIPYTNVGYSISGIETDIEGVDSYFLTDIEGSGGLNNFQFNYGYSLTKKLRLGISSSLLFGNITQLETNYIGSSTLIIKDRNNYSGFQFGAGMQYDISKNISFGGIVNFPTKLAGKQQSTVSQSYESDLITDNTLDSFELPLEIGFGFEARFDDRFIFNLDYRKNYWDATEQSDNIGHFVDQQFLGFGLQYEPDKRALDYFKRMQYRIGFNMDDGNLSISNERINNYAINFGVGFPTRENSNSMINLGYSYGSRGQVSYSLLKENYHSITLNISLEGIWFQKRKIF
jgi:opacity protein-like surface antigen